MPRILAKDKIGDIDSPPFTMIPGQLAKNGAPVKGFYYEEQHGKEHIWALRPDSRVPSDIGNSHAIEYIYQEVMEGYKFWTLEAGHRVNLDGLLVGILNMHQVDDFYDDNASQQTA